MKRIAGHALQAEGAAFLVNERGETVRVGSWRTTGGFGRGHCECGDLGPLSSSAADRKRWHRQHKASLDVA